MREKPNRNAFSACEVLYHMLDVEQLWQQRIHGMVDGTIDKFQQMNPDKEAALKRYNSKQYERGLRELAQSRAQTAAQILQLSPAELARTALHPKFGPMNTLKILETMEAHDRQHAAQLEKTLALVASTTTATAGTGC
ncbi:MAG: DinB family protein [Bacteroidota bacterium]|nr:DinB family protein [Bacteroidota bacterium]